MQTVRAMGEDADALLFDLKRFLPEGMTLNSWAVAAGVNRAVWGDIRRHGNPSRRTLEKLLKAAGSSLAEFEALRIGAEPLGSHVPAGSLAEHGAGSWRGPPPPPLPVRVAHEAGMFLGLAVLSIDKVTRREGVARPASLMGDPGAYAVVMAGSSMWPRFREGRTLAISSGVGIVTGDDVLIHLARGSDMFVMGELVDASGGGWTLRQFNPDRTAHFGVKEARHCAKVLGELI